MALWKKKKVIEEDFSPEKVIDTAQQSSTGVAIMLYQIKDELFASNEELYGVIAKCDQKIEELKKELVEMQEHKKNATHEIVQNERILEMVEKIEEEV